MPAEVGAVESAPQVPPSPVRRFARAVVPPRWRPVVWRICHPPLPGPPSRWRLAGPWPWPPTRYRNRPTMRALATRRQRVHLAVRQTTSAHRPLPDYVCIGALKAGTTALDSYLRRHPQVAAPVRKEIRFFAGPNHARGSAWYRAHFPLASQRAAIERRIGLPTFTGESTPDYLHRPEAAARAAALVPGAKLVLLLRDPAARAISHYHMAVRDGVEDRPIRDAMRDTLAAGPSRVPDRLSYLDPGYYAAHLRRWYEHFDRDQILVVPTHTLTRDGGTGYARILAFIGLAPQEPPSWEVNVGAYDGDAIGDEISSLLREHYQPHDEELWSLIGDRWDWDDRRA